MASKILDCSYSPNSANLNPLQKRQVDLLNRNGTQDISHRVGRLVSKYLNYQGRERFEAEVTKTKITFHLLSDPSQTRVLEYRNNKWQLTTGGATALPETKELGDDVQAEVSRVIDEVLDRINNASKATFDDDAPASHCIGEPFPYARTFAPDSSPLGERLTRVEERLARLEEALLRSPVNLGHDASIAPQLAAVQAELRILSDQVQRLRGREVNEPLDKARRQHEEEMVKAQSEIQRLKDTLRSLEERFSKLTPKIKADAAELKALREKDAQAAQTLRAKEGAHAEQIRKLETQLTASKAALETSRRENAETQTTTKAEIAALQEQITKLREEHSAAQQKLQRINEDLQRQLAAGEEKYARLEETQTAAIAENKRLAQESDALRAQLSAASKEKAELEARLKALEESAQTSQAALLKQKSALEAQLKAQAESLEAAQTQLTAKQAWSQQQAEQLNALETALAAERAKIAEMQKEKEQQMAKLTAENDGNQKQLAEQQEQLRKLFEEKLRAEQNLTAARATIETQSQELEALRKRLEEMRAEKARQISAAYTRTTQVREETARAENEIASLLQRFAKNPGINSTGNGGKV